MALRFKAVTDEEHFIQMARQAEKSAIEAERDRLSSNRRAEIARGKRPLGRPRKESTVGEVLYDIAAANDSVASNLLEGPGQCSGSSKEPAYTPTLVLLESTSQGSEKSVNTQPTLGVGAIPSMSSPTTIACSPHAAASVTAIGPVSIESRLHYTGRKLKLQSRPAKYTNWFTERTWGPIEEALRKNRYKARQTVDFLKRKFPSSRYNPGMFDALNESTVRGWVNKNGNCLTRKVLGLVLHMGLGDGSETSLASMARREQGNIFSSVPDVEKEFRGLLEGLRSAGHIVNSVTVGIMCKALLQTRAPHLLVENGGSFRCSRSWVRVYLATKMGWTFHNSTTNASTLPLNWKDLGNRVAGRLAVAVKVHNIPPELVINMDQTGLPLVPVSGERTYALRGSKEVGVAKRDDKRSITVVPAVTAAGELLPFQVIFTGKSKNVLPMNSDAQDARKQGWHFTFTTNHWSNLKIVCEWFDHIVKPYYTRVCASNSRLVYGRQKLVVLLDCWSVHRSKDLREWVQIHHPYVLMIFVPAGTTSKLQPCDVIVQRPLKAGYTSLWTTWATIQAAARFKEGMSVSFSHLDLAISTLRCKAVEFLLQTWHSLNTRRALLCLGWQQAGLNRAWDIEFQSDPHIFEETFITPVVIFDRLTQGSGDGEEVQPDRGMGVGPWAGNTDAVTVLEHCAGTTSMEIDINSQALGDEDEDEVVDEGAWEEAYRAYLLDPLNHPDFPM